MHSPVDQSPLRAEASAAAVPGNLLRVLWQRKWLVVLGLVVGLVLGALVYARTSPPTALQPRCW